MGAHCLAQVGLCDGDRVTAVITATHWALLDKTVFVLKDVLLNRATVAVEFAAIVAVALDVFEIELGLVAVLAHTVGCLDTALDQRTSVRIRGQVKWCMHTSIL